MKTIPKLIVAPIQLVSEKEPSYRLCHVTTYMDAMQEPNLATVICKQTSENLLPEMDSVSKQRTLHQIFAI